MVTTFETAFFESPAHHREVIKGIAAGVLALKYAYAGSGARRHNLLARSDDYQNVTGSAAWEADALREYVPYQDLPSAVVDIGPGNGVHSAALISDLLTRGVPLRNYLGIDFSKTLLALGREHLVSTLGQHVTVRTRVWDVEAGSSAVIRNWRAPTGPVLVGLVGATLGNVENIPQTLANIYSSTAPDDILVVTVAMLPEPAEAREVLAPYRSAVFRDAALEPLRAAGIDPTDIEFQVALRAATVVGKAKLRTTYRLAGRRLRAGHTVRCFRSRRFTPDEVPRLLDRTGWQIRRVAFDEHAAHAFFLGTRRAG